MLDYTRVARVLTRAMPELSTDKNIVELAGRNWLASQLFRAGLEVARPERDRGIDLIAYLDMDKSGRFAPTAIYPYCEHLEFIAIVDLLG